MVEEDEGGAFTLTAANTVQLSISEEPQHSDTGGSCRNEAVERKLKPHIMNQEPFKMKRTKREEVRVILKLTG